jgi:hypothetical protein
MWSGKKTSGKQCRWLQSGPIEYVLRSDTSKGSGLPAKFENLWQTEGEKL